MAGPMPGSTPIAVPRSTPSKAYSRFSGVSAVPKPSISEVRCVHQRMPFRMPTGRTTPRPKANRYQEPKDSTSAMTRVPDVVPAAEREGRAPEEDRAGDGPAERLDQQRVGDEGRREHERRCASRCARSSSTSSPPSGSPRPPRSTSRARKPATITSRPPTTIGTAAGPTGPTGDPALRQAAAPGR